MLPPPNYSLQEIVGADAGVMRKWRKYRLAPDALSWAAISFHMLFSPEAAHGRVSKSELPIGLGKAVQAC